MTKSEKGKYLSILLIPHDERGVRSYRISYRTLKLLGLAVAAVAFPGLLFLLNYSRILSTAWRVGEVEQENAALRQENARVRDLAVELERAAKTYEQIRELAGANIELPPLPEVQGQPAAVPAKESLGVKWNEDGGAPLAPPNFAMRIPSGYPLARRGYITKLFSGLEGHTGIDIAVPTNTPVQATADGVVQAAGWDEVYGYYVLLQHQQGYNTLYAHNARIFVEEGDLVKRQRIIALSGNTGKSSAPHLHYEVRKSNIPVEPQTFLR